MGACNDTGMEVGSSWGAVWAHCNKGFGGGLYGTMMQRNTGHLLFKGFQCSFEGCSGFGSYIVLSTVAVA